MGKTLFNSTISEKKKLRERLSNAREKIASSSDSDEVLLAICVTEDALTLHEMHKVMMDLQYNLMSLCGTDDVDLVKAYVKRDIDVIADFYAKLEKRKKRLGR